MSLGTIKLGAIMAAVFAVGVGGTYFGMQQTDEYNASLSSSSGMIMGHVTATVLNADGEITAYRQSDNAIVEQGMELIAGQLFEGANQTATFHTAGLIAGGNPVDSIGIGLSGTGVSSQDTTINFGGWPRCDNVTTTWSVQTDNATYPGGATSNNNIALIGINGSATFGPSAACADTYLEAGAFDNDTSAAMFARNTYNSVTLGAADSLIINWNFQFNDP
jgi:hypothetical protein